MKEDLQSVQIVVGLIQSFSVLIIFPLIGMLNKMRNAIEELGKSISKLHLEVAKDYATKEELLRVEEKISLSNCNSCKNFDRR